MTPPSMPINDLPKDIKTYERIAAKALAGVSPQITAKPLVNGYKLSFRVHFKGEQTYFYIDGSGRIVCFDPEYDALNLVSLEILNAEYLKFEAGCQEEKGWD
jgi:hypothetical protein